MVPKGTAGYYALTRALHRSLGITGISDYAKFLRERGVQLWVAPTDPHDLTVTPAALDPENIATFVALMRLTR